MFGQESDTLFATRVATDKATSPLMEFREIPQRIVRFKNVRINNGL